jgi:hypothetical protein
MTAPTWTPDPTYVANQAKASSDKDWDFWAGKPLEFATQYAAAVIRARLPTVPAATPEEEQAVLRDTLTTIETWLKSP